mmetsp:Transcript_87659/g.246234  ORF Transcript_87659/g.246234 Transcript_87659/m.246234 type:complete len:200 (+) Transcript_87659:1129-1728(+)
MIQMKLVAVWWSTDWKQNERKSSNLASARWRSFAWNCWNLVIKTWKTGPLGMTVPASDAMSAPPPAIFAWAWCLALCVEAPSSESPGGFGKNRFTFGSVWPLASVPCGSASVPGPDCSLALDLTTSRGTILNMMESMTTHVSPNMKNLNGLEAHVDSSDSCGVPWLVPLGCGLVSAASSIDRRMRPVKRDWRTRGLLRT